MELLLPKLLGGRASPAEASADFDFSARSFEGFTVPTPVHFHYCAVGKNGEVTLNISLRATISAECARCLTPFVRELLVEKEYRFTRRDFEDEFPELPLSPDGRLDLEELAYGELVLEADPVLLCSEDCEGLCQHCGQPKAQCQCEEEPQGDPRLQVLRQLLNDDE